MVREGTFREDLYYRLNVFSITLPPLRERREDVPMLVEHFLHRFAESMNKHVTKVSADALELLSHYEWPGNIRELQNAMERAVLVCRGETIGPRDFPVLEESKPREPGERSLAAVERDHIREVLEDAEWNISRSARLLRIDRVTLYNKIKKYGLKRESSPAKQ